MRSRVDVVNVENRAIVGGLAAVTASESVTLENAEASGWRRHADTPSSVKVHGVRVMVMVGARGLEPMLTTA